MRIDAKVRTDYDADPDNLGRFLGIEVVNPYEPPHILGVPSEIQPVRLNIKRKPLFFPEFDAKGYILEDAGGLVANKEVLYLFEAIIESPIVVFDQFDQRFCYCGVPGSVITQNGAIVHPNVHEVGLAFAKFDDASAMVVVNRIAWCPMCHEMRGFPRNWKDMGPKIWPL